MAFDPKLNYGDELNNKQLIGIFKCSTQGGMRKSNKTNTLVLISDMTKPYYKDKWQGDVLHYTGMGLAGNQDINFAQNKTLTNSNENGIDVFLFEVIKPKVYTYRGRVKLIDKPYLASQVDQNQNIRKVWIFPIKILSDSFLVSEEELLKKQEEQEKKVSKLSAGDIEDKAKKANNKPEYKDAITKVYSRDAYVAEFAKLRANGICQLCKNSAPFNTKDDKPYLEVHHIVWLSENGDDSIDNTVALCPNCHKKMHILNRSSCKSF